MNNTLCIFSLPLYLLLTTLACGAGINSDLGPDANLGPDAGTSQCLSEGTDLGIIPIPDELASSFSPTFCKAMVLPSPTKGNVYIVAQDEVSDEQLIRSHGILLHYLAPLEGATYGSEKAAVFDAIASRRAVLTLFNGRDDGANPAAEKYYGQPTQPLFAGEIFVEGSAIYQSGGTEEDGRDAAFEEILHFVHDNGIGVDGSNGTDGALVRSYQGEIRTAMENARSKQIWPRSAEFSSWITELAGENSLTQEYLAGVNDAYYGLSAGDRSEGPHRSTTREELEQQDPQGFTLIQKFLAPNLSFQARVDPSYTGNFRLKFDANELYTHKSRYLLNARLLGTNDSGLVGNANNNTLQGNAGNNVLDGGEGEDTAQFEGVQSEYSITREGDTLTISDTLIGRDGNDTLRSIEFVQFDGERIAVSDL